MPGAALLRRRAFSLLETTPSRIAPEMGRKSNHRAHRLGAA